MGDVVDLDAVRTEKQQQRRRRLFLLALAAVIFCTWTLRA
jgi:hypothetical protein